MTTDRRAWAASLIAEAMEGLARRRPVFHVERDFQLSLGWQFYLQHPAARVSLEPRLSLASNNRLDVYLHIDGARIALELKYPVDRLAATLDGEPFRLSHQSNEDGARSRFIVDLGRVERFVADGNADVGVTLMLTNVRQIWGPVVSASPADEAFRLTDGRLLAGRLSWARGANWWRDQKLPESVDLLGRYICDWRPYSTVAGTGNREFRWLGLVYTPA